MDSFSDREADSSPRRTQEEPQGPVSSSLLASVWGRSAKTNLHPSLKGSLAWPAPCEPVATSCAGGRGEGQGWGRGKRKSLCGRKPQGIHHAALSRGLHLPGPASQGSLGDGAGQLEKPCLPERGSHRAPPLPAPPWSLDNQESFRSWPSAGVEAGARIVVRVRREHAEVR